MVSQYPAHLDRFDQDYLILPDGQCVLGVAYTLAYGYWVGGRIEQWVDRLEARLADEQLTGDRRVNWLLARAQAEEIRRSPPYEHWLTVDRFLAGRGWIEEACLVAQSEPVRLRAYRELAARLTAEERLDAAQRMLDRRGRPVPERRVDHGAGPVARRTGRPAPSGGSTSSAAGSRGPGCLSRATAHALPAGRGRRRYAGCGALRRICFPPPVPARSDRPESSGMVEVAGKLSGWGGRHR